MKSLFFFDKEVLSAADSRVHSARFFAVLIFAVALGWSAFELFAWRGSVPIEGTIAQIVEEGYRCGRLENQDCSRVKLLVEFRTPSGEPQLTRLETFGGPSHPLPGQSAALRYNPYLGSRVFWDSVTPSLIGPISTALLALFLATFGYGSKTRDEKLRRDLRSGNLSGVFDAVVSSFDGRFRGREFRSGAFLVAVFSLLGKMAEADGVVTPEELERSSGIADKLELAGREREHALAAFAAARTLPRSFSVLASDCARMYGHEPGLLRTLYGFLEEVAQADGAVQSAEANLLLSASQAFFGSLHPPSAGDSYSILGIDPSSSDAAVRVAYRRRKMELDPARLWREGLPQGFTGNAEEKRREVEAAFAKIRSDRGMR